IRLEEVPHVTFVFSNVYYPPEDAYKATATLLCLAHRMPGRPNPALVNEPLVWRYSRHQPKPERKRPGGLSQPDGRPRKCIDRLRHRPSDLGRSKWRPFSGDRVKEWPADGRRPQRHGKPGGVALGEHLDAQRAHRRRLPNHWQLAFRRECR